MSEASTTAPLWHDLTVNGYHDVQNIEVDVPDATMDKLVARTAGQWSKLGEEDPYWSVLTDEANRGKTLVAEQEEIFYKSGDSATALLELFERRAGVRLARGVCLELGCGVGRLTRNLAQNFERVIAVDISAGNLNIAKRRLASDGIKNVEFRLIKSLADLVDIPEYDAFYSIIVLQHNSPPMQKAILDIVLPKARSGALFQTATNIIGYRFLADEYLGYPDTGMEVHAIPQRAINASLRKSGLELHETMPDTWIGAYGSSTFFATRPRRGRVVR